MRVLCPHVAEAQPAHLGSFTRMDPGRNRKHLVVCQPDLLGSKRRLDELLPHGRLPGTQRVVDLEVLLRDGVGSDDDRNAILLLDEPSEIVDPGARWIADKHASGQMDDGHSILLHLGGSVFDVAPGAPAARGTADKFHFLPRVDAKRTLAILHSPEALPSCACMVPVAHNHPDTHDFAAHETSSSQNRFTPISLAAFGPAGQVKAPTDYVMACLQA